MIRRRLRFVLPNDEIERGVSDHVLKHTATRRRRQEVPLRGTQMGNVS